MEELRKAKMREAVCLTIGQASMCWSEIPKGVFQDTEATRLVDELMAVIEQYAQEGIKYDRAVQRLSTPKIIRDAQGNEIARSK